MIGETSFIVTARSRDGKVTARVAAVTPYGQRSSTVDVDITDEKILSKIESAFEAATKSVRVELKELSVKEAARAIVVAGDNKESIYAE